jgi:WD40 repeat protein
MAVVPTACHVRDKRGWLQVWDAESGQLHCELEGFGHADCVALAFVSADGQQPRLVAGSSAGHLRVYDPEAGSVLHHLDGHSDRIRSLACIASSSAAPHHPRLVSASDAGMAKVWDGETGERLADLEGHTGTVMAIAVWKEHTGGHDRIATATYDGHARVWDGEAFNLLHDLGRHGSIRCMLAFKSAEGPTRLLVGLEGGPLQLWDPEEGRLLHDGINRRCPSKHLHVFESAQGRHLLAIKGGGLTHSRYPGQTPRSFLDVWDLGEAPAATVHLRPAHHLG